MLNRDLHSTYGPIADTGGLMQNNGPVIYAYPDLDALLEAEAAGVRGPGCPARVKSRRPSDPDYGRTTEPSMPRTVVQSALR